MCAWKYSSHRIGRCIPDSISTSADDRRTNFRAPREGVRACESWRTHLALPPFPFNAPNSKPELFCLGPILRQADVRVVTPAGLTPLHALAMYNARWGGEGADHNEEGLSNTAHDGGGGGGNVEGATRTSPRRLTLATTVPTTAAGLETAASVDVAAPATSVKEQSRQEKPRSLSFNAAAITTRQQRQEQLEYQLGQRKLSVDHSVRVIADLLLDAGSELNAVDGEGNTPLLVAAATGGAALCELLLARGADSSARSVRGYQVCTSTKD